MVILHIACVDNNPFSGVCVAAPWHVLSQMNYANVGFINVNNCQINKLQSILGLQLNYERPFDISKLQKPFNKPDLVVFHECYRIDYLLIYQNLKKNCIPYIIMPHGELRTEAQHKKYAKKKVANLLLFNKFIYNAVAIQCLSQAEMESTKFENTKFIGSNGIAIPDVKKISFNLDKTIFLYIGRYEWRVKGLDLLLKAIYCDANYFRNNNCIFELYGPNYLGQLDQVKELARRYEIEDIVHINSEIMGKDKENKLLEADLFVQSSRHEGLPMGILEAMSYGLPCLVTEGTSMSNIIQSYDAGWGVSTTAEGISEGIKAILLNKEKLRIKGENARKLVSEQYEWNKIAKHTVNTYQELLELEENKR